MIGSSFFGVAIGIGVEGFELSIFFDSDIDTDFDADGNRRWNTAYVSDIGVDTEANPVTEE